MSNIVDIPKRRAHDAKGWICGCGGQEWTLYADGDCLCNSCRCISTVIEVVMTNTAAARIRSLGNQPGMTVKAARDCENACREIERLEAWLRYISAQPNNANQHMQWSAEQALSGASALTASAEPKT